MAAAMVAAGSPADAQEHKAFRWTASQIGSYGYAVAGLMAEVASDALGRDYNVSVMPYTSPIVAMKAVMNGDGEIAYTADVAMAQLHDRIGGFKDYKPAKPELAHTWYGYTIESMMATAAKNASRFKCWKDFSGQPVFFTPMGFMNWLNFRRIYDALGYDFKHVQIDVRANASALETGKIVGSVAYTTGGRRLAPYWQETQLHMDIHIVNPCAAEVRTLKAAGLPVVDVDPKVAFSRDVGPKTLEAVPILFGYNARLDVPEDVVYRLVSTFYRRKDELAKLDPGLTEMAADFVGMQVRGIDANPAMPVHPGLARFLREHKAWNGKWKVGTGG
jgi:TRAP-type uncharacterized transport system substrate-binding protein